jgi:hypothetical protein
MPCGVCGRTFAPDRLAKHQSVCRASTNSKRAVFDVTAQRVRGTDLEEFAGARGGSRRRPGGGGTRAASGGTRRSSRPGPGPSSGGVPKWKREHEELIRNVRAARQATRHLANGGDVRDLPPPPPATEDPSFVPCPHCSRTFAPNAAERHIPKCATAFSRPNPPPRLRSGGGGGGGGADGYARSPGGGGGRGGAGGPIAQVRRPGSRGRGAGGNSRYSVGRRDDHSREGGWDSTGGGGGGWDRDRDSYNGGGGWDSGPSGTSVSFSAYESPQRLRPRQPPSARTPNSAPPKRRPMSSSSSSASASRLNAALRSGYV